MQSINIHNFPTIDHGHVCASLNKKVQNKLHKFPQTYSRAECAISFCWFISGGKDTLFHDDLNRRNRLREGFLRAALAEFVSMEETLIRDLDNTNSTKTAIKINNSSNPLLHILRELRNLEIHLNSSTLSADQRDFMWKPFGEERNVTTNVWYIDNLQPSDFLQLRNARNYNLTELEMCINRFLAEQKEWGIQEMIIRGVNSYSEEIIDEFYI